MNEVENQQEQSAHEEAVADQLHAKQDIYQQQATEEKAQEEQERNNKMGWGVFLFSLLLSVIADAIEIFTLGTIGWFTGLGIDFILLITLGFTRAGQKQWKKLVGALFAESIPFVNALPIRTIMLTWSFLASRHPLVANAGKALGVTPKISSPIVTERR